MIYFQNMGHLKVNFSFPLNKRGFNSLNVLQKDCDAQ